MREIKFRGVDIATGDFACGGIDIQRDTPIITSHGARYFVEVKTIGQYTGLKDVNGVEIYEGDIVEFEGYIGEIIFDEYESRFSVRPDDCEDSLALMADEAQECFEVIGNIYKDQDLLS